MTPKRALQIFVGLLVIGVVAFVYRWKTLPVLEEELPPEDVPMGAPTNTEEWHPVIPEEGETTASKEAEELQQKMEEALRAELENTEEIINVETATSESTSTTKNSTVKVPTQKIPEATKQQRNNEAEKKGEIKKYKTKEEAAKAPEAEKKQQEQKQAEIRNENKGYDPWANVDPSMIRIDDSGDGKSNPTPAVHSGKGEEF